MDQLHHLMDTNDSLMSFIIKNDVVLSGMMQNEVREYILYIEGPGLCWPS